MTVLDDLSTGERANLEQFMRAESGSEARLVEGSVLDHPLVVGLVRDADVVVHLAASVGVQLVVSKPLETLLNNIRGTEVVLDAANQYGTKVMVASTSEIYGKNAVGPLHEESDRVLGSHFKSRWAYSISKAVDEILAHQYWLERRLPTIVARLFNCAGPRQTGAYGMVIPRFVGQALAGEDLTVFGDGTQSRCFCHVSDMIDALILLLGHDAAVGDVFNVGSQNEISVRALAELVVEMTGSSSGIRFVPYGEAYEPGFEDMERRLPSIDKIRRMTGWEPSRSLRDIIQDVIEYQQADKAGH